MVIIWLTKWVCIVARQTEREIKEDTELSSGWFRQIHAN